MPTLSIDGLADAAQEARHPRQDGGEAVPRCHGAETGYRNSETYWFQRSKYLTTTSPICEIS